jgi:nucleotide-binding universal stress UspA family protein
MKTNNKILVALDLEEQAMIALQYAVHFGKILKYDIEAITVVEESNILSKLFASDEIVLQLNKEVQEKVDNALSPYKNDIKINTTISYGKPYEKVMQHAAKIKPCFIVMGRSEYSKHDLPLLGSNCMHVILEAGFPVLTIRGHYNFESYSKEHREILVPLDLKKGISEQLTASIEFAKLFKTSIRLIAVQTSGGKGREAKMLSQIAQTKKMIAEAGIVCIAEIVTIADKSLTDIICEEAEKRKALMIIIMVRSEGKITDFIIGSKALEIINKSNLPVMNIEPWDMETGSEVFSVLFDPLNILKK